MKASPFSRVSTYAQALAAALVAAGNNMSAALAQVGTYTSRGHGQNKYPGRKKGNRCTDHSHHMNSARECQRRMAQIAKGQLTESNGLVRK